MGNDHNVPFVAGFASVTPSVISVGATVYPGDFDYQRQQHTSGPSMANFSSRGPGFNAMIKPDLVAPSGLSLAAAGTGQGRFESITGTSFSAPLVAGTIALLIEKCGRDVCSPLALKSLVMNNAYPDVRYTSDDDTGAPVSWMGAGELHTYKALNASFWAYSLDDVQPSISLGVVNAASEIIIRRTIRVHNLASYNHTLILSSRFQDRKKAESNTMVVEFQHVDVLEGNIGNCTTTNFIDVVVLFRVDAAKAPANHMTSAGKLADNPAVTLDVNEFGGHVTIASREAGTNISLPFMAILRQASNVSVENSILQYDGSSIEFAIGLTNHGEGVAQIDSYQLISLGEDRSEANFGDPHENIDMRMVGYRVLTPQTQDCTYLFEWAFQTWEIQDRLLEASFEVQVDVDGDLSVDYYIFNSGIGSIHTSDTSEILVRDAASGEVFCTGFTADHHTFSATTIIRVCSDDLGITDPGEMIMQARVISIQFDGKSEATDISPYATIVTFPDAEIFSPSFDVLPGETLEHLHIGQSGRNSNGAAPLGLMLVTDAYRRPNSTGAATAGTSTIVLLTESVATLYSIPEEKTADILVIPQATDLDGPTCSWDLEACPETGFALVKSALAGGPLEYKDYAGEQLLPPPTYALQRSRQEFEVRLSCPEIIIPPATVPTVPPS
jgi:Subtilase family